MEIYHLILWFFLYAFMGWCCEVAYAGVAERRFVNRGFLNGPICPVYGAGVSAVILLLNEWKERWVFLYLASVILVTLIEGITGYVMDKIFHHKWWDYSDKPLNIGGYVCLPFSMLWGVACVFIVKALHPLICRVLNLLPAPAGWCISVILLAVFIPDLCVTTAGILKLNRRLEAMEKIAAEMRELSDRTGVHLYEKVSELQKRYGELANSGMRTNRRLLKAFPRLESRKHKDILNELREHLEQNHRRYIKK